jgi:threonine/homoserine/homoserine lactone efflux protein
MEPDSPRPESSRQTIVTTFLTMMAATFFLLLIVLISGGYLVYLLGIIAAIVAFGGLHYLLWGRYLLQQTANESEEEQLRQRALAEDEPDDRIRS